MAAYCVYTVKKITIFPSPAGMSQPNSQWPGIIKLCPARESLVSDIPAGDEKIDKLFLQCMYFYTAVLRTLTRNRFMCTALCSVPYIGCEL